MNLKVLFGRYQYKNTSEEAVKKMDKKVQYVLQCIKGNKYFSDPLKHACDDHTLVIMNGHTCVGTFFYQTSFEAEVLYQIDFHPEFVANNTKTLVQSYYRNCISLIENMLKTMGYMEFKVWLLPTDEAVQLYLDAGYKYLDSSTNTFEEIVDLYSKIIV